MPEMITKAESVAAKRRGTGSAHARVMNARWIASTSVMATVVGLCLCSCGESSDSNGPGNVTEGDGGIEAAPGNDSAAQDALANTDGGADTEHTGEDAPLSDSAAADSEGQEDAASKDDAESKQDAIAPSGTWLSGSSGNGFADGTFGNWRGRPNEIAGTWCDNSVDDQVNLWSTAPGLELDGWQAPIDIAVGAIYKADGESWEQAAAGAYDDRWSQSLNTLKSRRSGKGTSYIRFAHEFNGDWWPHRWMVTGAEAADFIAAWRRFRGLQQAIFPESKLVWCPNDGTSGANNLDVRDAWPGDEYVDVVGVDSYNWWPFVTTADEFAAKSVMTDSNGAPHGLETWRQFAEQKGLPLAISEWASNAIDSGGGGGDAPGYMEAFHAWLTAHSGTGPGQVLYEVIFNQWETFELWPNTKQPDAAAKYRDLW